MGQARQLEKHERDSLRRLLVTLAKAREVLGQVEIQQLETLLYVAVEGQVGQQDVGTRLHLTKAAASRNVDALSSWTPKKLKGPGFVDADDDPQNRRYKVVRITPQGQKFVSDLVGLLMHGR